MKVPGKPRRSEIDFVRGVAILLVMTAHFHKPVTGNALLDGFSKAIDAGGGHGVDLFFVLSGFLVGGLLLREYRDSQTLKPGRFLIRRMFKIWPAYYFLIFFHLLSGHHPAAGFFWQNFFHLQNYLGTSIAQTWSLAVEEHFYLFLALLLGVVASLRWSAAKILTLLAGISLVTLIARTIVASLGYTYAANFHSEMRIDGLMFGVMIALLYHFMPELYRRVSLRAWPLILITLGGIGWGLVSGNPEFTQGPHRWLYGPSAAIFYVSCGAFMLLCMEHSGNLTRLWIYRVVALVGIYSYGLYLWHSAFLAVGDKVIARFHPMPAFFLAFAAEFTGACIVAYVTTRLIEWPALYWRESIRWLKDSKPLAADPAQQIGLSSPATETVLITK